MMSTGVEMGCGRTETEPFCSIRIPHLSHVPIVSYLSIYIRQGMNEGNVNLIVVVAK